MIKPGLSTPARLSSRYRYNVVKCATVADFKVVRSLSCPCPQPLSFLSYSQCPRPQPEAALSPCPLLPCPVLSCPVLSCPAPAASAASTQAGTEAADVTSLTGSTRNLKPTWHWQAQHAQGPHRPITKLGQVRQWTCLDLPVAYATIILIRLSDTSES